MVRLASGVLLAAAAVAAVLYLPLPALRLLACAIAAGAGFEYAVIAGIPGQRLLVAAAVGAGAWMMSVPGSLDLPILGGVLALWLAAEVLVVGRGIQQAAAAVVSVVYVAYPLGCLVALHAIAGWQATLLLMGTVVVSDSAQYYTGRLLGRRPLAPTISPKKTVEGALGGLAGAAAFMAAVGGRVLPGVSIGSLLGLGVLLAVLGICGDLFESRLKRVAGLKDSSALIPGHGGILDRVDALLFATPAFYLYCRGLA